MQPSIADILVNATAPAHDPRPMPRALLVYAHPDDEVIAVGARFSRFADALLIHVTDGAPADGLDQRAHHFSSLSAYRQARREEFQRVLQTAGVPNLRHECLGIPDKEAALQLTALTRRLMELMQQFRPEVVFTHPYEGGHPDHDACAFAVHNAVALLRCHREQHPVIIEAPFYRAARFGILTGEFLPTDQDVPEVVYDLTPAEQQYKRDLLACFASQQETLSIFRTEQERFRVAPTYEFRRVPHPGDILYDSHPWGVSSKGFIQLATEAEDALKEEMRVPCS